MLTVHRGIPFVQEVQESADVLRASRVVVKPPKEKLRVVVLGSGWGAMSFLRNVDGKVFAGKWGA